MKAMVRIQSQRMKLDSRSIFAASLSLTVPAAGPALAADTAAVDLKERMNL
jgi:hypothetical protein